MSFSQCSVNTQTDGPVSFLVPVYVFGHQKMAQASRHPLFPTFEYNQLLRLISRSVNLRPWIQPLLGG